jgi:protein-L-isoaspartate(D-aspartate) O-methyltransferase
MPDFTQLREQMIQRQIAARGINDPQILAAFREVPRHLFVAPANAERAYGDFPIPIAAGQTISQPFVVAAMIEAAEIKAGDHVLEVGSGSGYATAVISRIAGSVVGIERHQVLADLGRERLQRLGYDNAKVVHADGTKGWPEDAPYDAIIASATGSHVPQPFIDQLKPGGRIVMPVGGQETFQQLVKVKKLADGTIEQSDLRAVRFVPLIGEHGWQDH